MAIYSIRMRASKNNEHISGAERIASASDMHKTVSDLINRALLHEIGEPDEINISIESLKQEKIKKIKALNITTILVDDYKKAGCAPLNSLSLLA